MNSDFLHIFLGFIEGLALILSPCILPILPIILSTSLAGNRKRPMGIIIGFVVTFAVFTFFIRQLTQFADLDANVIRVLAYSVLFILAVIMISPYLSERLNLSLQRFNRFGSTSASNQSGFGSGLLFGSVIALIWTPCAGPILAAVIIQVAIQKTSLMSFLTLFAFCIGVAIPMLLIAVLGRKFLDHFQFLKMHTQQIRQILGVVILLSLIYLIFYADKIDENIQVQSPQTNATQLQKGLLDPYSAPEISEIEAWINSPPLKIQSLRGKVILIDFWAYTCINCIRTLPYLRHWHQQYQDKGLVIIGVHAPEFEFEKQLSNVQAAVQSQKITYPVALDNQFATWRAYHNQYWPAHYLIDQQGKVVYTHFGEGENDVMENNIRYLLHVKNKPIDPQLENTNFSADQTPETYLGYSRAEKFASAQTISEEKSAHYTIPESLKLHQWALSGQWQIFSDRAVTMERNAAVALHFHAQKVFAVMGNTNDTPIKITVMLDNQRIGEIIVDKHKLYDVIQLPQAKHGVLKMIIDKPGLEIYTFTFGS